MNPNYLKPRQSARRKRYSRPLVHEKITKFSQSGQTQQAFAKEHNIPPATFQYWTTRIPPDAPVAEFFESTVGLECLHRIVLAARFLVTLCCGGGIRMVSLFLQLSQLDRFVAASTGSQHAARVEMEEAIGSFEKEQKPRLVAGMKSKAISISEDETFHPKICLVGIEPVSNYIFLEKYVEKRDAETWNGAVVEALEGLPIKVIQSVSDEGRALVKHIKEGLGVHQAPDLFHVQNELNKATSYPLRSQLRRLKEAQEQGKATEQQVEAAESRVERAKSSIQGLSEAYHLFDLKNGQVQSRQEVGDKLDLHLVEIEKVATEAGLGERSQERIAKAKRVLPKMRETIAFVYQLIVSRVFALQRSKDVNQLLFQYLLPGLYLQKIAKQTREAEKKHELVEKANELLACWNRDGPEDKAELERLAEDWVMLFVRTSSMVEGRNSHLRQRHRSLHRLSERTLRALTVVHNYFIQRSDEATAAERFFGQKPDDLFEYLVKNLEVPRRPAKKRNKAA